MKLILKDIISGFHEEIREESCREQLPFFYWKWKMKMLQPGTVSRLQKKSLAAFHAALSLFSCNQVPPVVRPGGRTLIRSCILQLFFFYSRLCDSCSLFGPQRITKPLCWHTVGYFLRKFGKKCPALILR